MLKSAFNPPESKVTTDAIAEELARIVADSNEIPWNNNWRTDRQIPGKSANSYMHDARSLRINALEKVQRLLELTPNAIIKDDNSNNPGYYSLGGRDFHGLKTIPISQLIEEIEANDEALAKKSDLEVELQIAVLQRDSGEIDRIGRLLSTFKDLKPDNRFLKTEDSVKRKIENEYTRGSTSYPEEIGDYLRFQVLYETAEELAQGRHTLQSGKAMTITSQKDRLRFPHEDSGHRAFMAHAVADNGNRQLKFEIMLSLVQVETHGHDKTLRDSWRACQQMANASGKHREAYAAAAGALDSIAKLHMCELYDSIPGMDKLLDPTANLELVRQWAREELERTIDAGAQIVDKLPTAKRWLNAEGPTGLQ